MESTSLFGPPAARDALRVAAEANVARAVSMTRRARALVLADRVGATALLTAQSTKLGDHLQRYQRFKHGSIFDPVVRHGLPSSQVVARTMKVDCVEMGHVFGAHHARWQFLKPADWPVYREDLLVVADRLSAHLDAELRAIRQLLMLSSFYGR